MYLSNCFNVLSSKNIFLNPNFLAYPFFSSDDADFISNSENFNRFFSCEYYYLSSFITRLFDRCRIKKISKQSNLKYLESNNILKVQSSERGI